MHFSLASYSRCTVSLVSPHGRHWSAATLATRFLTSVLQIDEDKETSEEVGGEQEDHPQPSVVTKQWHTKPDRSSSDLVAFATEIRPGVHTAASCHTSFLHTVGSHADFSLIERI